MTNEKKNAVQFHQKAQIFKLSTDNAATDFTPLRKTAWTKQYSGNIKVENGKITEPDYLSKITSDWDLFSPPKYDYDDGAWNEASKTFDLARALIYCDLAIEFESYEFLKEFKGALDSNEKSTNASLVMNNIKSGASLAFSKLRSGLEDIEVDVSVPVTVPLAGTTVTGAVNVNNTDGGKSGIKFTIPIGEDPHEDDKCCCGCCHLCGWLCKCFGCNCCCSVDCLKDPMWLIILIIFIVWVAIILADIFWFQRDPFRKLNFLNLMILLVCLVIKTCWNKFHSLCDLCSIF